MAKVTAFPKTKVICITCGLKKCTGRCCWKIVAPPQPPRAA
jgi:hypothetical protein